MAGGCLHGAGNAALPRSMRASSPHVFLFIFLPPAASVSPLDRDKVTDLDLEKNANRIFPYLIASQILLFFILPPAASVSPLDRDKVTDLDLEKILSAFSIIFPFYSRHSIKKSIDKSEKIDYTFHWIVPKDMEENNSSQHMGHSWKQKRNR